MKYNTGLKWVTYHWFPTGNRYFAKRVQATTSVKCLFSKEATWYSESFKKRLRHRCFPVNFAIFLRTSFYTEHLSVIASVYLKQSFTSRVFQNTDIFMQIFKKLMFWINVRQADLFILIPSEKIFQIMFTCHIIIWDMHWNRSQHIFTYILILSYTNFIISKVTFVLV